MISESNLFEQMTRLHDGIGVEMLAKGKTEAFARKIAEWYRMIPGHTTYQQLQDAVTNLIGSEERAPSFSKVIEALRKVPRISFITQTHCASCNGTGFAFARKLYLDKMQISAVFQCQCENGLNRTDIPQFNQWHTQQGLRLFSSSQEEIDFVKNFVNEQTKKRKKSLEELKKQEIEQRKQVLTDLGQIGVKLDNALFSPHSPEPPDFPDDPVTWFDNIF